MAKVSELITGAYELSNIIPGGEVPEAFQMASGLRVLNQMLAAWAVDRQGVHSITKETLTLVAGTTAYTIGSGADFDTTRPNRITYSFVTQNNQDYPLRIVDREWQASRLSKTAISARPYEVLYEPDYPNGKLTFFPNPDQNYTVELQSVKPLAVYAAATDALNLPPEYEQAIEFNLAILLANRNGTSVAQETAITAQDAYKRLKRLHGSPVRRVRTRITGGGAQRDYDITGDYYY